MAVNTGNKMTNDEIARRYDGEVDRFSDLTVGQETTVDSPINLRLLAAAASRATPDAATLLDLGSGAGNASLSVLQHLPLLSCTLVDLSPRMLERARLRLANVSSGAATVVCADLLTFLRDNQRTFDLVVAATSLHHLRHRQDWTQAFADIYRSLTPGGSLWITDLVKHEASAVQDVMWESYGDYLIRTRGKEGRDRCFEEIEREDTPETLTFQLELLRSVGFRDVDVLHKSSCFALFGGIR